MYDHHYKYIKDKYRENVKLLLTHTDSLTYEIGTDDVYEDKFDFSEYSRDSKFYDDTNTKVIVKMKDAAKGVPIVKFSGSKSKIYSLIKEGGRENKRVKGISESVVGRTDHCKYIDKFFKKIKITHIMKRIQGKLHQIGTYHVHKITLSCFDYK